MKVAFTGHRPDKLGGYADTNPVRRRVKTAIEVELAGLLEEHPGDVTAISGMALGVDQWAVEVCLALEVPYIVALPFVGQEKIWPPKSQAHHKFLVDQAVEVVVVCTGGFEPWKLQRRNEWMVDHCDLLLAAWDGTGGGTANCCQYARSVGRPMKRLEW